MVGAVFASALPFVVMVFEAIGIIDHTDVGNQ